VTKSFTSALTGIALREGLLRSLDQKLSELLPEYFNARSDARKRDITLRHLLTMTAGFEWIEVYKGEGEGEEEEEALAA
jgi:CubicO group peptidase (beta-lactamase class C family)